MIPPKDKAIEIFEALKPFGHGGLNEEVFKAFSEHYGRKGTFSECYAFSKVFWAKKIGLIFFSIIIGVVNDMEDPSVFIDGECENNIDYWLEVRTEFEKLPL